MQLRHLRLEIFLTFPKGFWVFKAHFFIKCFLQKKERVRGLQWWELPATAPTEINLFTANICLFKVNNKNSRKRCETCSNLTIKTQERRPTSMTSFWCFNCLIWAYFKPFCSVSFVDFEQVNVSLVSALVNQSFHVNSLS